MGDTETYTRLAARPMQVQTDGSRIGTTAEWVICATLIPAAGQECKDLTAGTVKLGDGTKSYAALSAIAGGGGAVDPVALAANPAFTATYGRLASEAVPRSRRIWMVGDSITNAGNGGVDAGAGRINGLLSFSGLSIIGAALMNMDGRCRYGGVAATGGFTAAQIHTTHLPTVLANATAGDLVVVLAGTNDGPGGNVAGTIATLTATYAAIETGGMIPVPCTIPPNKNPAEYVAFTQAVNLWMQRYALTRGYVVADFYGTLVDAATGSLQTAYDSGDNTHLSAAGAWAAGIELARAVNARVPAAGPAGLPVTNAHPSALFGATNALFLADANADGIPDGFSKLAATGTSTFSLTTDVAFAGRKMTATRADTNITLASSTFTLTPGNRILFAAKIKVTGATGGTWTLALANATNGTFAARANGAGSTAAPGVMIWDFVMPSGFVSNTFRVDIYAQSAVGVAVEIGQVVVRDLTAEGIA